MKVMTDFVPNDVDYLTAGKVYELHNQMQHRGNDIGMIFDDTNEGLTIRLDKCAHIGFKPWTMIDE